MENGMEIVAYLRTSSAANVGEDKDSHKRQLLAIEKFAKHRKATIVSSFYDAAVSGAGALDSRPGFTSLLAFLDANSSVRTIAVETANRFARDLIVQEIGYALLRKRVIDLIAAESSHLSVLYRRS